MDAWVWLAAYLVGFALLQLALYRYFQRGESTESESREPGYKRLERSAGRSNVGVEDGDAARESGGTPVDSRRDAVVCQQCGALNERDSMFSYCRECASPLR
jgi:hypothetical protein